MRRANGNSTPNPVAVVFFGYRLRLLVVTNCVDISRGYEMTSKHEHAESADRESPQRSVVRKVEGRGGRHRCVEKKYRSVVLPDTEDGT